MADHGCIQTIVDQRHDSNAGLDRYGWLEHDGFYYGKQELLDHGYNITTTWVCVDHVLMVTTKQLSTLSVKFYLGSYYPQNT